MFFCILKRPDGPPSLDVHLVTRQLFSEFLISPWNLSREALTNFDDTSPAVIRQLETKVLAKLSGTV